MKALIRAGGTALLLVLTSSSDGPAQHVEGNAWPLDPQYAACSLCHAAHSPGGAPHLLKTADIPDAESQAPALSATSRSCLRCHWTLTLRDQQPEFLAPSDPATGGYLGPDLSDDHVLRGQAGQLSSVLPRSRITLGPLAGGLSALAPGPGPTGAVDCVDCHEPHAPGSAIIPDPVEQQIICTRCHDPYVPEPSAHASLACTDCHQMHGANPDLLRDPAGNPVCGTCHSGTPGFAVRHSPGSR